MLWPWAKSRRQPKVVVDFREIFLRANKMKFIVKWTPRAPSIIFFTSARFSLSFAIQIREMMISSVWERVEFASKQTHSEQQCSTTAATNNVEAEEEKNEKISAQVQLSRCGSRSLLGWQWKFLLSFLPILLLIVATTLNVVCSASHTNTHTSSPEKQKSSPRQDSNFSHSLSRRSSSMCGVNKLRQQQPQSKALFDVFPILCSSLFHSGC